MTSGSKTDTVRKDIERPVSPNAKTFWLFMNPQGPGTLKIIGIFSRKPCKATREYFGGVYVKVRIVGRVK